MSRATKKCNSVTDVKENSNARCDTKVNPVLKINAIYVREAFFVFLFNKTNSRAEVEIII